MELVWSWCGAGVELVWRLLNGLGTRLKSNWLDAEVQLASQSHWESSLPYYLLVHCKNLYLVVKQLPSGYSQVVAPSSH